MRVLVSTNPIFGHFTPMIPLAQVLQAWDHDVVVASAPQLADVIGGHGLTSVNVGGGSSQETSDALMGPWFRKLGERAGVQDLNAGSLYRYGLLSYEPFGYYDWGSDLTVKRFRPSSVAATDSLGELEELVASLAG